MAYVRNKCYMCYVALTALKVNIPKEVNSNGIQQSG